MATLLWPGKEFTISHQEVSVSARSLQLELADHQYPSIFPSPQMIKGIRLGGVGKTLTFLDTLTIPIIENTPDEEDLTDSMAEVSLKGLLSLTPTFDLCRYRADEYRTFGSSGDGEVPPRSRHPRSSAWALLLGSGLGEGEDADRVPGLSVRGTFLFPSIQYRRTDADAVRAPTRSRLR
jgi:hypothetical protein